MGGGDDSAAASGSLSEARRADERGSSPVTREERLVTNARGVPQHDGPLVVIEGTHAAVSLHGGSSPEVSPNSPAGRRP